MCGGCATGANRKSLAFMNVCVFKHGRDEQEKVCVSLETAISSHHLGQK